MSFSRSGRESRLDIEQTSSGELIRCATFNTGQQPVNHGTGRLHCLGISFYSETGRPSNDPGLLQWMLLVRYLYGITSERKLVEELRMHLAWRAS